MRRGGSVVPVEGIESGGEFSRRAAASSPKSSVLYRAVIVKRMTLRTGAGFDSPTWLRWV